MKKHYIGAITERNGDKVSGVARTSLEDILNAIKTQAQSRAELAARFKVSPQRISWATVKLRDQGLIYADRGVRPVLWRAKSGVITVNVGGVALPEEAAKVVHPNSKIVRLLDRINWNPQPLRKLGVMYRNGTVNTVYSGD